MLKEAQLGSIALKAAITRFVVFLLSDAHTLR
jgi:hypothetical protein